MMRSIGIKNDDYQYFKQVKEERNIMHDHTMMKYLLDLLRDNKTEVKTEVSTDKKPEIKYLSIDTPRGKRYIVWGKEVGFISVENQDFSIFKEPMIYCIDCRQWFGVDEYVHECKSTGKNTI